MKKGRQSGQGIGPELNPTITKKESVHYRTNYYCKKIVFTHIGIAMMIIVLEGKVALVSSLQKTETRSMYITLY
jgi:hypothetical protein